MRRIVSDAALDILFRYARSHGAWLDRPVSDTLLRAAWELVKLGPSAEMGNPARILFVRSDAAKDRLAAGLPPEERAAAMAAPVVAVLASDIAETGAGGVAELTAQALREGALRGGHLLLAARSLGLDCRPIWNFDPRAVQAAFFPDGTATASFLCAIGYGDEAQAEPRRSSRRFDEACRIL